MRLGNYEIEGQVGAGGMGTVLRGRELSSGRPVAIKVLRKSPEERPER